VHEAAHIHFSLWLEKAEKILREDPDLAPAVSAAMLLEESRVEKRQIGYRRRDREWLQASATEVVLRELEEVMKSGSKKAAASRLAALLLARTDAGILRPTPETEKAEDFIRGVFGDTVLKKLRDLWRKAFTLGNDNAEAMIELGKEWVRLTGDDGGTGASGGSAVRSTSDAIAGRDIMKALGQLARDVSDTVSGEKERQARAAANAASANRKQAEAQRQAAAKAEGDKVFGSASSGAGQDRGYHNEIAGYREPRSDELLLARKLRRELENAYAPERTVTRVNSIMPPGRPVMRQAMAAEAQRAAGVPETAEPFVQRRRRHVVTPPLKVGIVIDLSASQQGAADATSSGAWALARATAMIPDATVAMASFGGRPFGIIRPNEKVAKVPKLVADSSTYHFNDAVRAVEGTLDLTRPGSARLLVLLSDFDLSDGRDDLMLTRLTKSGCRVLAVITPGGMHGNKPGRETGVRVTEAARSSVSSIPRILIRETVAALQERRS
jgi:hypothetical protein